MIKKIFYSCILFSLLISNAMAIPKDMTNSSVQYAHAGDVVKIPFADIAAACDFSRQIVRVPDSTPPLYECIYIGRYRRNH
ncbi:MAG: hypothetical protein KAT71_02575 [Gammaproteobacteria bacterium]|nr:hypothetical protein [Gammaproteobacteria bacterium]